MTNTESDLKDFKTISISQLKYLNFCWNLINLSTYSELDWAYFLILLGDICAEDNPNLFMVSHFSGSKAILYAESAVLPLKSTNKYQRRTLQKGIPSLSRVQCPRRILNT